ncbi:unnamed protein product [Protopolystoma xenopodis]|uniref:Dynein light intermediate chain n=1 Tax=Protopolystoma xenopodis TaxID=117903 RepID=A0A3S4ZJ35_9PLAT|nr:unnamed protein product [Protopolystoma xenopodis]
MGVWCLGGELEHTGLLPFALNEATVWRTICLICLSAAEFWLHLRSLELWIDVLRSHINILRIDEEEREELQASSE